MRSPTIMTSSGARPYLSQYCRSSCLDEQKRLLRTTLLGVFNQRLNKRSRLKWFGRLDIPYQGGGDIRHRLLRSVGRFASPVVGGGCVKGDDDRLRFVCFVVFVDHFMARCSTNSSRKLGFERRFFDFWIILLQIRGHLVAEVEMLSRSL